MNSTPPSPRSARYPSWEPDYRRAYCIRTATPEKLKRRREYNRQRSASKKEHIRAVRKASFEAHPERREAQKAKQQAWYQANKKRLAALAKINRLKNRAKIAASKRDYYQRNREVIRKYHHRRYHARPEHWIKKTAEWTAKNRARVAAYRRNRYNTNPEARRRRILSAKKWQTGDRASGRERVRQKDRRTRHRVNITNQHVRELLAKRSSIPAKNFPQSLVELKKAEIRLKRKLEQNHE